MSAGQQMDVNMLYQKVVELSEVLKENREKTHGIVAGAEELAVRSCSFPANAWSTNDQWILDTRRCQWIQPLFARG